MSLSLFLKLSFLCNSILNIYVDTYDLNLKFPRVLLWGEYHPDGLCGLLVGPLFFLLHLSRKSPLTSCSPQPQGTLFHSTYHGCYSCLFGLRAPWGQGPCCILYIPIFEHRAYCLLIQQIFFWHCKQERGELRLFRVMVYWGRERSNCHTMSEMLWWKSCRLFSEWHSREGFLRDWYLFWDLKNEQELVERCMW